MFDRPGHGTEAVLVSLDFGDPYHAESVEEMAQLVASAGVAARAVVKGRRQRPDAALFAGVLNLMIERGWTRRSLKEGDEVTVYIFAAKNGAKVGNLQKIVLADGKELTAAGPAPAAPAARCHRFRSERRSPDRQAKARMETEKKSTITWTVLRVTSRVA